MNYYQINLLFIIMANVISAAIVTERDIDFMESSASYMEIKDVPQDLGIDEMPSDFKIDKVKANQNLFYHPPSRFQSHIFGRPQPQLYNSYYQQPRPLQQYQHQQYYHHKGPQYLPLPEQNSQGINQSDSNKNENTEKEDETEVEKEDEKELANEVENEDEKQVEKEDEKELEKEVEKEIGDPIEMHFDYLDADQLDHGITDFEEIMEMVE